MRLTNGALKVEILTAGIDTLIILKVRSIIVLAFILNCVIDKEVAKIKTCFLADQDIYLYSGRFYHNYST